MKFLLSILAILVIGINGQKAGRGGKGGKGADVAAMDVDSDEGQGVIQLNQSVPFNQTDKTQYSRREWMVIAITQFFNDFQNGTTANAPYIFARGCPYISNGAIYAGLDMSQASTWAVIPIKQRIDREFSPLNGTETWVRCIGVYPDGHQALEFTAFTFDRQGLINSMSKLENKECPTATSGSAAAPSPASATSSSMMSSPTTSSMSMSSPTTSSTVTTTTTSNSTISNSSGTILIPPVATGLRADTKRVRDTTANTVSAAPTTSPTSPAPTGKGKNGKGKM